MVQEEFERISTPELDNLAHINEPGYLPTMTLQQLYDTSYESKPALIDGLLYPGTYLFAGAPKVGKSFFMAQLAFHISTGQKLWEYEVHKGRVLYLALEDSYQRIQKRMARMFDVEETDLLHFAVFAKQMGSGLTEQLKAFVLQYPDTRLIIIDTLQKVRAITGDGCSYGDDYQIVSQFTEFSDQYGVCILLVHHTRKTTAGDKFQMISGTTGLLGSADGAFVMTKSDRAEEVAVLDMTGRDQADQRIYLRRNESRLVWDFDHEEKDAYKEPPDPLLTAIAKLITPEMPEWSGSATELLKTLGSDIPSNALTKRLNVRADRLLNDYKIRYRNTHQRTGSSIQLTLEEESA